MTNIEKVIDRLSAWADCREMTARHLTDSEAEPYVNEVRNYRELIALLENL
jgi:hypothetical protein